MATRFGKCVISGLALAGALLAMPAAAAEPTVSAMQPESVIAALVGAGAQATLAHDEDGEPQIVARLGGWRTVVVFYDCNDVTHAQCQSLQLNASFRPDKPFDAAAANAFVSANRFGAVAVDPDHTVHVTWDVITGRGLDPAVFALVLRSYRLALDTIGTQVFAAGHPAATALATTPGTAQLASAAR